MAVIGIDLGTTNSLVAQLDSVGRPQIVHNSDGENLTPSAILLESGSNTPIVGKEAKKSLATQPDSVAREFKRDMGTDKQTVLAGNTFSPTDLSALLLTKLRRDYEAQAGRATSVVVTVPANFNNDAREATLAAIRTAGLGTETLLNEPTAAALYYAYARGHALNGTYIVYDLGGGTFDVTVIAANGNDIRVLASEGVTKLGGKDFDDKVTSIVAKKFEAQLGKKFDPQIYGWSANDAEEVKKSLSQLSEKKVRLVGHDIPPTTLSITRSEFEEAISSLVAQTELLCETVLGEAGVVPNDIKDVFLAGGSSRIPLVSKTLSTLFGRTPEVVGNPDEAIALGAAIYAGFKADPSKLNSLQKEAVKGMTFQEVAPHYFGTIALSSETRRPYNAIIIEKNTPIPCSRSDDFFTVEDNQSSVHCSITQSPHAESDPRFVRTIWEGDLAIPAGRPRRQKIVVTYAYKENGTMSATFVDAASGQREVVDISGQSVAASTALNIDDYIVE